MSSISAQNMDFKIRINPDKSLSSEIGRLSAMLVKNDKKENVAEIKNLLKRMRIIKFRTDVDYMHSIRSIRTIDNNFVESER